MMTSVSPKLRAPLKVAALGLVVLAIGGAVNGWRTVLSGLPVLTILVFAYYLWARRDTDVAAVMRDETDERQADRKLRVQALVGRVMSVAVTIAFLVASAARTTLWPFAVLLCLPAATVALGWFMYGDHNRFRDDGSGMQPF